jgi:hypothetical protein
MQEQADIMGAREPSYSDEPDYLGQLHRYIYDEERRVILYEWHWDWRGRLHRNPKDGPAFLIRNEGGTVCHEEYYWHGKWHREDGPARISRGPGGFICLENWFRFGRLHRDPAEGPAMQIWDRPGKDGDVIAYYIHGFNFRDPRIGPMYYGLKNAEYVRPIYAQEIPPRPVPPLNWLRQQYGRKNKWMEPYTQPALT